MSKLETLIQQLCPDGVEYKKLGDIATITRGGNLQKKDFTDTGIPCIHYGQIYTKYGLFADKTFTFISEQSASKQKYAEPNDIVMAVTSENLEDVCKCVAWLGDVPAAVSGHTAIIHHSQNPKYLCYYFHSGHFQNQKNRMAHGTKVIEVTPNKLTDILLPVPPLEIQREIVYILDHYTEVTMELIDKLSVELTNIQKQYEYYKEHFLALERANMQWMPLGKICNIARGASPRPIRNFITKDNDGINWIKIGDVAPGAKYITSCSEKITIDGAKKSKVVYPGDFILSNSMSFGRPYILKIKGCIHDGWLSISGFEDYVSADYLYYILTSSFIQKVMRQKASFGGAVQNLNADIVRKIEIPVIPKETQNFLVSILDKFSMLCSSLSENISAEIEARQKQYEYYRDKLLTFKPLT